MVGKYIPMASNEYKSAYDLADIIWLKGQGNFQTMPLLNHYYDNIITNIRREFSSFVVSTHYSVLFKAGFARKLV